MDAGPDQAQCLTRCATLVTNNNNPRNKNHLSWIMEVPIEVFVSFMRAMEGIESGRDG